MSSGSQRLKRALSVFQNITCKEYGLSFFEAMSRLQAGDCVRRAGWKVVALCLRSARKDEKPFVYLMSEFQKKGGSFRTEKAWTPYLVDFQSNDWCVVDVPWDSVFED